MRFVPRLAPSLVCLSLVSLVGACAHRQPTTIPPEQLVGLFKNVKGCREKYAEMDARIDAAGVRNPAFYRVPGFPYFRTDRYAASFKDEVTGLDEVAGWMRRMHGSP